MLLLPSHRVTLLQREQNLHKDFPNNVFSHEVFIDLTLLYELGHVPILAILHHNKESTLLLPNDFFVVLHNVLVVKFR